MGILNKILKKDEEVKDEKKAVAEKAEVKVEKKAPVKPAAAQSPATRPVSKGRVVKKDDERAYKIIAHPLITEKATDLAAYNKYVFVVPIEANKSEVAKTVRNVYGVDPVKVNIIKKSGKRVRYGRRFGRTKDFKKAIITLKPEDKIEVYEGV